MDAFLLVENQRAVTTAELDRVFPAWRFSQQSASKVGEYGFDHVPGHEHSRTRVFLGNARKAGPVVKRVAQDVARNTHILCNLTLHNWRVACRSEIW